ncbi:hypothetical protein J1614_009929 [Plenodomus biglobosus]|nr:hypothetical protein J1614_009929 [Plenodomus biglobosus]
MICTGRMRDALSYWSIHNHLAKVVFIILLWHTCVVTAVGSDTHYPKVAQSIVRNCANNMTTVKRRFFCEEMANCILNSVSETTKSNMAAGSAMMALLPTAIWILAGGMEDVLSIARRDPYFALVMSFAVGGAQGLLRSGRPAEVDAGSWSVDTELTDRSVNAVVMPGLINVPGDSEAKLRFIRKELNLQHMKDARNMTRNGNNQQAYLAIGWLLRLSSAVGTGLVLWLYFVRQDSCYVAFNCPKSLIANVMVAPVPALAEYLATSYLEYREYWVICDQNLMCYTRGNAPMSARGVLRGQWFNQKKDLSYWQNMMPRLLTRRPVCTLVWKRKGLGAEVGRALLMFTRAAVYLFATVFFSAIVLLPARQATQLFMAHVGILLYNRMVLIALDSIPGVMDPVQEITIR